MEADSRAFGWIRSYAKDDVGGTEVAIEGLENGSFDVTWFDTWNGAAVSTETQSATEGRLSAIAPSVLEAHPDIAFKIKKRR